MLRIWKIVMKLNEKLGPGLQKRIQFFIILNSNLPRSAYSGKNSIGFLVQLQHIYHFFSGVSYFFESLCLFGKTFSCLFLPVHMKTTSELESRAWSFRDSVCINSIFSTYLTILSKNILSWKFSLVLAGSWHIETTHPTKRQKSNCSIE